MFRPLFAQDLGKLFSDFAGRFSFMMFIVLSTPLGLHHQFADPGIASAWKGMQMVLTLMVAIPSMLTAFTVAASLEYGARQRGGTGLFGWWKKLPYFCTDNWMFSYLFCGLFIFLFGGVTGLAQLTPGTPKPKARTIR
jgi:cytochrome c oxidase subunit 1